MISRICSSKFRQVHIISVSGDYLHFIYKICQIVAGTSMISQFHEFFDPIYGGVLRFGPTVCSHWSQRACKIRRRKVTSRDEIDCKSEAQSACMYCHNGRNVPKFVQILWGLFFNIQKSDMIGDKNYWVFTIWVKLCIWIGFFYDIEKVKNVASEFLDNIWKYRPQCTVRPPVYWVVAAAGLLRLYTTLTVLLL